jgi:outer membrane protein
MKKLLLVPALLVSFLASVSAFAVEGLAVIDMRTAVLATQVSKATFTALEEESEYAGNVEQAQLLQADRQAIAEKLQKDGETLSQAEIAQMQKDLQVKTKDLEFIAGKIQAKQNDTAERVFNDQYPAFQKILQELMDAKEIKLLFGKDQILVADAALDLTDDVTSMLDVAAAAAANGADKK